MRDTMQKKFDNLDDLNLTTNLLIIQELAKKWIEKKPNNPDLIQLRDAILQTSLLSNKLLLDRGNYHLAMDEYKSESLRMVQRARRLEDENKALQEEVSIYRKKEQLGL